MASVALPAIVLGSLLALSACGGASSPAEPPSEPAPTEPAPAPADGEPEGDLPESHGADRPEMSQADCESAGGTVVGDIGDGAIHRPDYKCPSGDPPLGTIAPEPGGPIAVEGSVCCGG